MTTADSACYSTPQQAGLQVETLPFSEIPGQSKLFLDYLNDPVSLRRFYPSAAQYHHQLADRIPEVLDAHQADRADLCDRLDHLNRSWGGSEETLKNIAMLRESDSVAVVTGQQAGLFTGPLYTIYKALSAVKFSQCLNQRGYKAVPVFWIATEDHDFAEVAWAEIISRDCRLEKIEVGTAMHASNQSVGEVVVSDSVRDVTDKVFALLPDSEFREEVGGLLRECWTPGRRYGDAFARMLTQLLGKHGLVLMDPLDPGLKKLASPLYAKAIRKATEIARALTERSSELEAEGYHAQVVTSADAFPLFIHTEDGGRHPLVRGENGWKIKGVETEYASAGLLELAARNPERLSPNVTMRSVVQDYLLPTVAYFGGSSEIAYFAQTSEVYRVLERPVTPIIHRASMTIVESRTGRALERYDLGLKDFFEGHDSVVAKIVEGHLGAETADTFDQTESRVNSQLDLLREKLREVDPTLAEALETGRRKINHQLHGLRSRFHRAHIERNEAANRQIERAFDLLYPDKSLQERRINVTSFLGRHGRYVLDWIYDAIDPDCRDHLIVYL